MATDFKVLNMIRRIPMFGELSVDEAKLVLSVCQQKEYQPNEVIFKYGGGSSEMLTDIPHITFMRDYISIHSCF